MKKQVAIISLFALSLVSMQAYAAGPISPLAHSKPVLQTTVLGSQKMSLEKRYGNKPVNDVMKDNILLTLYYLSGKVKKPADINWDTITTKPFQYDLVLAPGEAFAFHEDALPEFSEKVVATTHATFGPEDGFKSDGYLYGDGVCHFASLINWAAQDAGLSVTARVNHNFAKIPEIDAKYGTSIYYAPGNHATSQAQNLYVVNNRANPVHIVFTVKNNVLDVTISEEK